MTTAELTQEELEKKYELNDEQKAEFEAESNKENVETVECFIKVSGVFNIDMTEFNESQITASEIKEKRKNFIANKINEQINGFQILDMVSGKFVESGLVIHQQQFAAKPAFSPCHNAIKELLESLKG